MKKITFTILVLSLFSIGFVKAQAVDTIPNGDFERWQGIGKAKEKPQSWDTLGGISFPVSDVSYLKDGAYIDRPVYDGKTALSLACQSRGSLIYIGEVICKLKVKNKNPYLNMNLGYMEGNAPQSPIFEVTVWNSKTHDTLCKTGILYLNSIQSAAGDTIEPWGDISIPLAYTYTSANDTTTPDSCHILLTNSIPSNQLGNPSASVLYVEKIWFGNAAAADISVSSPGKTLASAYPNPFTNKTTISYNLAQNEDVNLTIYNMEGREIRTLINSNQSAGSYNEVFDANGLSNGVYIYKLQTSSGVETGKLMLNR